MERIQSALAKARASRTGQDPSEQSAMPPLAQGGQPAAAAVPQSVTANWDGLERIELKPRILRRNRILSFEGGNQSTHYDMLRTRLVQQMKANNWTRIAITSPGSSCGKTTTAANLAFSLGRQSDQRVILCELDLRRPSLARTLGVAPGTHQFAEVVKGKAPIEDHMFRASDNVAFATNHSASRNPSELLQSKTGKQVLDDIQARFDPTFMIFDMPPMMVSDDTMAFVQNVDCVLLVAAAESTSTDEVDLCERDLSQQTNVVGVVLNKCRYMGKQYGYSYYD
jgi:capsular exopolysaccharide synthesis family protein